MNTNGNKMSEQIYTLRFRKRTGAVKEVNFSANPNEVETKARKFCTKHEFSYIFTKPFLTDIDAEFDPFTMLPVIKKEEKKHANTKSE